MAYALQKLSERLAWRADAPLRIFVVEDSADVRDLIMELFAAIPVVVLAGFSETKQGAMMRLAHECYEVLILDIQLKQGHGIQLLQSLADSGARRHAGLTIIFSNQVSALYRRAGLKCGAHFFFDKSSEYSELHRLIERLCGRRFAAQQEWFRSVRWRLSPMISRRVDACSSMARPVANQGFSLCKEQ